MQAYQKEFIEFALAQNVLRFGKFTLKSGRESPYFFNAGLFSSGQALAKLGKYYAQAIIGAGSQVGTYDIGVHSSLCSCDLSRYVSARLCSSRSLCEHS